MCLRQYLRWQGTMARVHLQFAWTFCALLLELSETCDLFILYDCNHLELP